MTENQVVSPVRRLAWSLGTMFIILVILVLAILLFVSFGDGPSWPRGITGIHLSVLSLYLAWLSLGPDRSINASWIGIISGMTAWMVIGEISHQFGFVEIESEEGIVTLVFLTVIVLMLWKKKRMPWGFQVFCASYLLNWWGHAVLLPQLYLAEQLDAPVFYLTYQITGGICLVGFIFLLICIWKKPADKAKLVYFGLWLYALLVARVEGVTNITANTFGH